MLKSDVIDVSNFVVFTKKYLENVISLSLSLSLVGQLHFRLRVVSAMTWRNVQIYD